MLCSRSALRESANGATATLPRFGKGAFRQASATAASQRALLSGRAVRAPTVLLLVHCQSLVVGIVLMILSGIVCGACLLAPGMTNGRASFEEAMLVFIPSAILFVVALLVTIVAAMNAKKTSA